MTNANTDTDLGAAAGRTIKRAANAVEALISAAARRDRDVVCQLIDVYRVPVDMTINDHPTALCYAAWLGDWWLSNFLLQRGASPHYADSDGLTPLHYAAWGGNDLIAASLIAAGAEVNAADENGYTPLALAVSHSDGDHCAELLYRYGGRSTAGQSGPQRFQ